LLIIPNGVDLEVFRPSGDRATARQKLAAIPSGQPLVTYVGRLVGEKGIFTLLRAFAAYRRTAGNGFLLLAGHAAADEVAALHRLATELGLPADAWRVQTATDRPEEIYRAADIAVTPSEWDEPFGLAPLEAMACGAFALVSDRGVLPSFVASIGQECVFPAGDATALARRLSMWLGNPAAREGAAKQLMENTRREYAFATCGDAYLEAFANRPPT
jgi:glycosyltransferase involved in cell wall biosynthesis